MLDGDPGLGKSLLALDLAARVTTGREMPDTTPGVDGGVVLLSAEDDLAATVRPRLETAWADLDRVEMMRGVTLYDTTAGATQHQEVLLPRDIRVIERLIWQVRARLVVIDPLMAYLDMKVNSWRDQDVRSALAPLAALAERTGAAILILRHLNKATGTSALYRGGGSIGIVAAARSGLLVAKAPDNPEHERVLAALKSNLGPPLPSLRYRITESVVREGIPMVEWLGECTLTAEQAVAAAQAAPEDAQPSKLEETVDWLHAALVDGPRPGKELERAAHAAGISDATLRRGREQLGVRITRRGYGAEMRAWWSLEEEVRASDTMRAESGDASSPVVFNSTSPVHHEIMSGTDTDEHD